MKAETKDKPLLVGAQLVKQPELITVKTISPKIVEQMEWLDDSYGGKDAYVDWPNIEIIGALPEGGAVIVQQTVTGGTKLGKLRGLTYIMYLMDSGNGMTNEAANIQYHRLPQLFAA